MPLGCVCLCGEVAAPPRAAFPRGHPLFPALMCRCLSRITRSSLRFDPAFPDDIHELNVTGVSYLGNKLRFSITREEMGIEVTESPWDPPALPLEAVLEESGQRLPLHKGALPPLGLLLQQGPCGEIPELRLGLLQGRGSRSPRLPDGSRDHPLAPLEPRLLCAGAGAS